MECRRVAANENPAREVADEVEKRAAGELSDDAILRLLTGRRPLFLSYFPISATS